MTQKSGKQKLYCYVDESGQETEGAFFLVAVVIVGSAERDQLRRTLAQIEKASGKQSKKWTASSRKQREAYMRRVVDASVFIGLIYYSQYRGTRAYENLTIESTAKAIRDKAASPYEATILVDGLTRTAQNRFAAGLRNRRIRVRKVRGIDDRTDEFIRLADAVAGFVRDSLEGDKLMHVLYQKALQLSVITEV